MTGDLSSGPARAPATTAGVDAHAANEFDIRNGLAGEEAKPFGDGGSAENAAAQDAQEEEHRADGEGATAGGEGLVHRPNTAFPPSGQQGAAADRPEPQDP